MYHNNQHNTIDTAEHISVKNDRCLAGNIIKCIHKATNLNQGFTLDYLNSS